MAGASSVTLKSAARVPLLPSVTVALPIDSAGGPAGASSLRIVPVADAPLLNCTVKVSFDSICVSPATAMAIDCVVVPGAKRSVPLAAA